MKPNASKNQKLVKQFPFVTSILNEWWLLPLDEDGENHRRVDDLTIKIQKADGDLMYRVADNIGLYDSGHVFTMSGSRKNQVMRRGEYLFAVDTNGQIINRVVWPLNRHNKSHVYAWNVLWAEKEGDQHFSSPIHDKVEYLVWVSVEAWHQYTQDMENPFGEFVDRIVKIVIYGKPDIGFYELDRTANVYDNLYLDSRTITRGVLDKDYDIISIDGRLGELCRLFQDEVYFNGMKSILDSGNERGASGTFGSVKILVGELCGYDRIMLEDNSCWISFQLRPEGTEMYVLGLGGTLPQIRNLTKSVVKMWTEQPETRQGFKPDKAVHVL